MEELLTEILARLRTNGNVDDAFLEKRIRVHNKQLEGGMRPYSKRRLVSWWQGTADDGSDLRERLSIAPDEARAITALLQMKPRRTSSGVATITVITKPHRCAGTCLYCPNDVRMPKSYLHAEPACQRAERNFFDPYLQVASRMRALQGMGHPTDKVELIVLGGTWCDYPQDYQVWFVGELFRALNDDAVREEEARIRRDAYKEAGLSSSASELKRRCADEQSRVDARQLAYNAAIEDLYEKNGPWQTASSWQKLSLEELRTVHKVNETARSRVVGLVVETRPDTITAERLTLLRMLGCTKVQMGVQTIDAEVQQVNRRPIDNDTARRAFELTRLFGFKIHAHFMVNLLGSDPERDIADYRRFVSDPAFSPDEIKLYPCALIGGTDLVAYYRRGTWVPYGEDELVDVLVQDTLATPSFTRISRMIRDFSAGDIIAGNKKTNLRQMVEARLADGSGGSSPDAAETQGERGRGDNAGSRHAAVDGCDNAGSRHAAVDGAAPPVREIRYRELNGALAPLSELQLDVVPYPTTATDEFFLQWITPHGQIAGFARLSLPHQDFVAAHADELVVAPGEAMIREVHVYGHAAHLHAREGNAQHRGLGKKLVERACEIAREHGFARINVISSVGTREYYRHLGFSDHGLYQQKSTAE